MYRSLNRFGFMVFNCGVVPVSIISKSSDVARTSLFDAIVVAYRYDKNEIIHRDLKMTSVQDEITRFAFKHVRRLEHHINTAAIQLLDNSQDVRRLKRLKPFDLV